MYVTYYFWSLLYPSTVYIHPQQMLWTKDLQMNTVHVLDVCRAVWHLCNHGNRGQVYNIVDSNNTSKCRTGDGTTGVGCLKGVMKGKGVYRVFIQ